MTTLSNNCINKHLQLVCINTSGVSILYYHYYHYNNHTPTLTTTLPHSLLHSHTHYNTTTLTTTQPHSHTLYITYLVCINTSGVKLYAIPFVYPHNNIYVTKLITGRQSSGAFGSSRGRANFEAVPMAVPSTERRPHFLMLNGIRILIQMCSIVVLV